MYTRSLCISYAQKTNIIFSMTVKKVASMEHLSSMFFLSNLSEKKSFSQFPFMKIYKHPARPKAIHQKMSEIAEADILNKSNAFWTRGEENIEQPTDIKHFKMLLHDFDLVCKAFYLSLYQL